MGERHPIERGTIAASLHRSWMELKDELNKSIDISAIVNESQRGESYIKHAYETALESVTGPRLRTLLQQQIESVKESYAWLSELKTIEERRSNNAH